MGGRMLGHIVTHPLAAIRVDYIPAGSETPIYDALIREVGDPLK